jgi:hypothetical protein
VNTSHHDLLRHHRDPTPPFWPFENVQDSDQKDTTCFETLLDKLTTDIHGDYPDDEVHGILLRTNCRGFFSETYSYLCDVTLRLPPSEQPIGELATLVNAKDYRSALAKYFSTPHFTVAAGRCGLEPAEFVMQAQFPFEFTAVDGSTHRACADTVVHDCHSKMVLPVGVNQDSRRLPRKHLELYAEHVAKYGPLLIARVNVGGKINVYVSSTQQGVLVPPAVAHAAKVIAEGSAYAWVANTAHSVTYQGECWVNTRNSFVEAQDENRALNDFASVPGSGRPFKLRVPCFDISEVHGLGHRTSGFSATGTTLASAFATKLGRGPIDDSPPLATSPPSFFTNMVTAAYQHVTYPSRNQIQHFPIPNDGRPTAKPL